MQRKHVAILATAFGFGLWLVSIAVWHREPWDMSLAGYCLLLALAGAVCMALARPRRARDVWVWPAWIVLGELLFTLFRPGHWSLWPLSLLAFAFFGLAAAAGAFAAKLLSGRDDPRC
jgi:hypothetical protein